MLPSFGPRVTISANTGAGLKGSTSTARPSDYSRTRRNGRPPIAPCNSTATLGAPTRKSLDGFKGRDSTLRPGQLIEDVQTLPVATSTAEVSGIPHSVSAASLSSESDLALLLGTSDLSQVAGSTPLVFGSFPPVYAEPSGTAAEAPSAADSAPAASSSKASSKLKPDSHEFYPQAYIAAAAAATALAARTISNVARSASPAFDAPAEPAQQQAAEAASTAAAAPEVSTAAAVLDQPSQEYPAAQEEASAAQPVYSVVEVPYQQQQVPEGPADPQQQQYWAVQQQQQPMSEQQWHQQQQQWQHWQQQQQAQHQMVAMPVLVPVYMQPYPYPHYVQQHPQVHYVMMSPDAAAAAAAAQAQQVQQQQQQQMQVCPPSPGGYSLPADTCSLMSATTPAVTPTAWHHNAYYGSSRPGSSAGSVVSAYSSVSRRQRQSQFGDQAAREAGTVTVSAMSCVKDAAGALAKVITRHNNALLLSLVKPGDAVAQATHVAAKSLAVARFYINAHMAAAGAAGIDAAAALTGMDSTSEASAAAASDPAAAAAAAAAVDDEVVFMPYHRSSGGRQAMDTADVPLGFMVAKASAKDLPVLLPPPVGIPACMQDKVAGGQQQRSTVAAASSSSGSSSSSATLLKAGANTDVNKLSNAVIHNILGSGHVAMQLAGAAACHVAMRSLVKARDRLLRKFNTDIVATASFANEDTSSSIGRSTVFLRLDVMRSTLLQKVADAGSAVVQAVEGQHQEQLAVATA